VQIFQRDHNLAVSGQVDAATWRLINEMRKNVPVLLNDTMLAETRFVRTCRRFFSCVQLQHIGCWQQTIHDS
jgi:hypothetical protein